ncbi:MULTISPECIES: DUF6944 family repetitive protein [Bacillaceae]|uniref:Uncharacterized protein n=1 Tax=Evansella alkalicola TaxID=745819 RepID=A0ABS6JWV2_9BACI|nr:MULTISPECIES: hypothetical protein [Bacillaceae]MBU9723049.1 hypothetical protein [Bacillus alkalicola]
MSNHLYTISNWIEAIGANLAALGVSIEIRDSVDGKRIRVIGDGIQGVGNFLIAETTPADGLSILGNRLQGIASSGNAVLAYREIYVDEKVNDQLEIISDCVQVIGSYLSAIARREDNPPKAIGNTIQALGALIEAAGVLHILKDDVEKGDELRSAGKWIQGFGTIIQAISVTPGLRELLNQGEDNDLEVRES